MGMVEALVLWVSFLLSGAGNVYLYGEVEEYKTKYEYSKKQADLCKNRTEEQRRLAANEAILRAARETEQEASINADRSRYKEFIQDSSHSCLKLPISDVLDSSMDVYR
jgi:hypothetical protein